MIPKNIHQIWFQGENNIPNKYINNINTIKNHHKTWNYFIWSDESIRKILTAEELKVYNEYKYMHQKIDFSKYIVLYKYGGVYIDMDAVSIKPLDDLIKLNPDKDFIASKFVANYIESYIGCRNLDCINNGTILSTPKNNILKQLINFCLSTGNGKYDFNKINTIIITTGPAIFSKIVHKYKNENTLLLESEYLDPCGGNKCNITKNTYIKHMYESSWVNPTLLKVLNFYFNNKSIIILILLIIILYIVYLLKIKKN